MRGNHFCRFDLLLLALLTHAGIDTFGKVSFARNEDSNEQSKCFNNLLHNLPNESFMASSVWRNRAEFEAHQAKMSTMIETSPNHHGQAWCSNNVVSLEPSEWLEIDLKDQKFINSFITMGRGDGNFKEFVSSFYLDYQREGQAWIRYRTVNNKEVMPGNSDSRNVARTQFESLLVARRIRIYPISNDNPTRACLRIAIYGCSCDDGVIEYSIPQGNLFTLNEQEKFDFRDLTYDGTNKTDKTKNSLVLVGGLGQLMDNKIYQGTIQNSIEQRTPGFYYVGWNRKFLGSDNVEIIMKLDQNRRLKEIRLYTLNMIPNEIGVFQRAIIHYSIGGKTYDKVSPPHIHTTIADHRVYHSRWIYIPINGIITKYLKLNLIFDLDWIVLSEIILVSEKSEDQPSIESIYPTVNTTTSREHITFSTKKHKNISSPFVPVISIKPEIINKNNGDSFPKQSNIGFMVMLSTGFLGLLLLIALAIFGIISIKRRHRRIKGKLRYPNYQTRMNGGPFIGDSLVVPLTGGTHSSSGTGSIYYKHPGGVDLGLSYPITGKEYMTLSSKSGTDYDMAGGNSLDGLLPLSKDSKFTGFGTYISQGTFNDNPYTVQAYSRHSNEGSLGSSYTEYATTSQYHFPQVFDSGSNIVAGNQHVFGNNSFQLQPYIKNASSLNSSPYKVQSPTPSAQIFRPNQMSDIFPQYSPYRNASYLNHCSPIHNVPSRFITPTNFDVFSIPYLIPENNFNPLPSALRGNILPPLEGIFGNSLMITTDQTFLQPVSTVSLTNILANLNEIGPDEIEHISVIGRGENGSIGYIRTLGKDVPDVTNFLQRKTYLSKSLSNYVSKDIRDEIVRELSLLVSIKHSAFMKLSSYAFDHQNSMSIKQLTLCFLFEIDEQAENLYTLLQQHSTTSSGALNLPRGPILYSQSISNISKTSNVDTHNLYPSVPSLMYICYQIAKGMSYLEIRKIIHRDLAARNCLVSQNLEVKITDIAMSIQKFKEHYIECTTMQIQLDDENQTSSSLSVVKQNYPLQWMASETILQGCYTIKSDVWSFGVTMWEIFTRCQRPPFGTFGVTIDRIIENANFISAGSQEAIFPSGTLSRQNLKSHNQHAHSQIMSDHLSSLFDYNIGLCKEISDLIRECWHNNSQQRPSFENISLFLEQKISQFGMESSSTNS